MGPLFFPVMFLSIMLTFWAFSFYYVGFHEIPTSNLSILLCVWTVCFQIIWSSFYFCICSIRLFFSFHLQTFIALCVMISASHLYLLKWTLQSFQSFHVDAIAVDLGFQTSRRLPSMPGLKSLSGNVKFLKSFLIFW